MSPFINMVRCRQAALAIACLIMLCPVATAQEDGYPAVDGVVTAYLKVRDWVNTFSLPEEGDDQARLPIAGATAVCVMLRHSGSVMGEGVAHVLAQRQDTANDARGSDDLAVRLAARRALSAVFGHPRLADMPIALREHIGPNLTLEMEVGGELVPLVGDTFEEAAAGLSPGLDGFALRVGDVWVLRFPSQLRADNTSAASRAGLMRDAVVELGLRRKPLRDHRAQDGLSVYRFRTVHLAQPSPDEPPFATLRGQRVVADFQVHRESLREFGEMLAHRLMSLEWGRAADMPKQIEVDGRVLLMENLEEVDPPLGMLGTYHPAADRYDPLIAPPFEQALSSYALSQFARCGAFGPEISGRAAAFAEQILFELADVVEVEGFSEHDPRKDAAACAMTVLAARSLYRAVPRRAVMDLAAEASVRTWSLFDAENGVFRRVAGQDGDERELAPHEKALVAAAMMRLAIAEPPGPDAVEIARGALDAAWASADPVDQVGLLPWIGWGEIDYTLLTGESPRQTELEAIRRALRDSQLVPAAAAWRRMSPSRPDADLVGGYLLAGLHGGAATADGLRPASWLSRLLMDRQEVSDDDLPVELGRLMQFSRFLMQLSITGADAWAWPGGSRAVGGIRQATWDSTQPLAAQALAVIVITDVMRGLDRVDKMR